MKKQLFICCLIAFTIQFKSIAQQTITSTDLIYLGGFKLPADPNSMGFSYGGTSITYHPANNSLYIVGHDWEQFVGEVSIPPLVNSGDPNDLNTATLLQPLVDPSEGLMYTVDEGNIKVGGLYVHEGRLIGSVYTYYDADTDQVLSHFASDTILNISNDATGMFQLGDLGAGFVSGYMNSIPLTYQSSLGGKVLVGQACLSIISRTSYGPGVFTFDPNLLGVVDTVPVQPLVYYPAAHPLAEWGATGPLFNGSTTMGGVVLPNHTKSVLFFGSHGLGEFCYGTGEECNDPVNSHQGTHAYPYAYQIWAYHADSLAQVVSGNRQPWEIMPYDVWNFDFPTQTSNKKIGGVAYDPSSGIIYLSQSPGFYPNAEPVVHAFKLRPSQIYVDVNADGTKTGLNWENAYLKLQDALKFSGPGDTIFIAEGQYYPDEFDGQNLDRRDTSFVVGPEVTLIGGYPSGGGISQPNLNATILTGDIDQNDLITDAKNNSFTVVELMGGSLRNLTVSGGYASGADANDIKKMHGGGIFATGSNTIVNCVVKENSAIGNGNNGEGGGIYVMSGKTIVQDCSLSQNLSSAGSHSIYTKSGQFIIQNIAVRQ